MSHAQKSDIQQQQHNQVPSKVEAPIVSADIIGDARASIVDLELTQVVDGDLVKVLTYV
ncbi:MAG: hypothetical protein OXH77_13555 [Anaerolineaceae bacterium]|nr:hypothetical protein [Anaerolineaceae bacterium]